MNKLDYIQSLRDSSDRHYNCAQALLVGFAAEAGLTETQAEALTVHFGTGMHRGAACGAVTGGLITLGLMGKDETRAREFQKRFKAAAEHMDCVDLLRKAKETGEERKPHCDRMVRIAAEIIVSMDEENGTVS